MTMNIYAQILIDEAHRRNIQVTILNEDQNLFILELGNKRIRCHESLTDRTSAFTMQICANKSLTHSVLAEVGLNVPEQLLLKPQHAAEAFDESALSFLRKHKNIVVKPLKGEQGAGITVGVTTVKTLREAIVKAARQDSQILLERFYPGHDIRIVVIDHQVIAAAERIPAHVCGDGQLTVKELIINKNELLNQQFDGESAIPICADDLDCLLREQGWKFESIPPAGSKIQVCRTANFHTGGQLIDITATLPDFYRHIAVIASQALEIPVVGLDLIVKDIQSDHYVIIEANERPGLANHEPHPTAERFIDCLFPETSNMSYSCP